MPAPAHAEDVPTPPAAESVPTTPVEPSRPNRPPTDASLPIAEQPAAAAVPTTTPPPTVVAASRIPLRTGAVGWRVRHVQERLTWLGYDVSEGNLDERADGRVHH